MDKKPKEKQLTEQEEFEIRLLKASPKLYVIYKILATVLAVIIMLIGVYIIRYVFRWKHLQSLNNICKITRFTLYCEVWKK